MSAPSVFFEHKPRVLGSLQRFVDVFVLLLLFHNETLLYPLFSPKSPRKEGCLKSSI